MKFLLQDYNSCCKKKYSCQYFQNYYSWIKNVCLWVKCFPYDESRFYEPYLKTHWNEKWTEAFKRYLLFLGRLDNQVTLKWCSMHSPTLKCMLISPPLFRDGLVRPLPFQQLTLLLKPKLEGLTLHLQTVLLNPGKPRGSRRLCVDPLSPPPPFPLPF